MTETKECPHCHLVLKGVEDASEVVRYTTLKGPVSGQVVGYRCAVCGTEWSQTTPQDRKPQP